MTVLPLNLRQKFSSVPSDQVMSLVAEFNKLDVDGKGFIDQTSALKSAQQAENIPYDVARNCLKQVNLDSSGRVELEDFINFALKVKSGTVNTSPSIKGKILIHGSSDNTSHTINEEERREFIKHINSVLAGDSDVGSRIPIDTETFEFFDECRDGLILCKLVNDSVPETIDMRVVNKAKPGKALSNFQITENNNIVINSAKALGLSVVNVGSQDIADGKEILILGLVWQIIRRGLLSKINITLHPELYRLLEEDEDLETFLRLPPEQILLRWFNYHLKAANWHRRVHNFSKDVADGENYTILLNQLDSKQCLTDPLDETDLLIRAEMILTNAEKLKCRKYLTPTSMAAGNPKLNLAFVAHLFNNHPGLEELQEEEKPVIEPFDAEGEREARVFTLWLNSLDVRPGVNSFFNDLRDGTILLQAFDKMIPRAVNWKHVSQRPEGDGELMRFKSLANTNYAVELGRQSGFSLVGIQGADVTDGQKTLTLGLVWQLMRKHITITLKSLGKGGRELTDQNVVSWANETVKRGGKSSWIRNLKDPAFESGRFPIDILNGIKSEFVDYSLVTEGRQEEDAIANARLAISIARKLGAVIFILPEDIVQLRTRLIFTFIASLMVLERELRSGKRGSSSRLASTNDMRT